MFKRLIKAIKFSISSGQDVLSQSVVEVLHGKIPREQEELCNTLYDLRMGIIEKGVKCETCSMDYTKCKGHFCRCRLVSLRSYIVTLIPMLNKFYIQTYIHLSLSSIKNYRHIDKVASCFHCSALLAHPRTSHDMFDVDNIEDLEEVSKTLTNMCQEDIDVLNIQGCHPKCCIMHYFPVREAFPDQQGWVFWRWFDMSTFWDNKGQQFGEEIPLFGYGTQCKGPSMPCF